MTNSTSPAAIIESSKISQGDSVNKETKMTEQKKQAIINSFG